MTITLKLDRDFLTGLGDFLEEAQKTYPQIPELAKVLMNCNAPQWASIKENIPDNWERPVYRPLANALEKTLIASLPFRQGG